MENRSEIATMLVLSTTHLHPETLRLWSTELPLGCYPKGDYGWFMYAPEHPHDVPNKLPHEARKASALARRLGGVWIMWDRDGPEHPDLFLFDHD